MTVRILQIDVDGNDGRCVALCDPMDLNEILANLIDNACKWAAEANCHPRLCIRRKAGNHDRHRGRKMMVRDCRAESMDVVFRIGVTPG